MMCLLGPVTCVFRLFIAIGADLKIVYMEVSWLGTGRLAMSDFGGFVFGRTTISHIRERFGCNGFMFVEGPGMFMDDEGKLVSVNSYAVAGNGVVASFGTAYPAEFVQKVRETGAIDLLGEFDPVLRLMSLAQRDYLEVIWGEDTMSDEGRLPITWASW